LFAFWGWVVAIIFGICSIKVPTSLGLLGFLINYTANWRLYFLGRFIGECFGRGAVGDSGVGFGSCFDLANC
jgi:hypothetical protein